MCDEERNYPKQTSEVIECWGFRSSYSPAQRPEPAVVGFGLLARLGGAIAPGGPSQRHMPPRRVTTAMRGHAAAVRG